MSVERVVHRINEEMRKLSDQSLGVPASDFAQYLHRVGQYAGLKSALGIIAEVEKQNEDL